MDKLKGFLAIAVFVVFGSYFAFEYMGFLGAALVLALLSGGLAWFTLKGNRRRADPPLPGNRRRYAVDDLSIQNVIPGGVLQIRGLGATLDDVDLQVTARHLYDQSGFTWFELDCESRSGQLFVSVVDDDRLDISVSGASLDLADVGLAEAAFEGPDDEPDQLHQDGEAYSIAETGRATFYRDSDRANGEEFAYWEYENQDRTRLVSVERWPSGFEVHACQQLKPSQVTVFANRGDQ